MRAFSCSLFRIFKGIDGISVYIFQRMRKGGEIMDTSSFEHIVRIQFNALMMTVIKCAVKAGTGSLQGVLNVKFYSVNCQT